MRGNLTGYLITIAAFLLALAATGCREVNGTVYSQYAKIGSEGWDPRNAVGFDPWPADSVNARGPLDVVISVRYSGRRAIKPLRMAVTVDDENGEVKSDTLVIPLFDRFGEPTGRGHYGVYEVTDTLLRRFRLRDGFGVELKPLDPAADTRGLVNVGVILTK